MYLTIQSNTFGVGKDSYDYVSKGWMNVNWEQGEGLDVKNVLKFTYNYNVYQLASNAPLPVPALEIDEGLKMCPLWLKV